MSQMPIPSDWNGEDWQCWSVQWPNSQEWNAILRGFITTPMRGRFWDGRTGSITDVQQIGVEIWDRNSPLEEVLMSCSDDALTALQEIAANLLALVNKPCCNNGAPGGGSAGAGIQPGNPSTQHTDSEAREGPPPPGFETWGEYDDYACNMAHRIIDDIITDVASGGIVAAGIISVQTLAPILVGAFLTPVPFDDIIVVAFLFIQLLAIAISTSELTSLMEDNRDDIVCSMLGGTDVNDAISNYADTVNTLCAEDGEISGLGSLAVKASADLLASFATIDNFNRLFEKVPYPLEERECSCGGEPIWAINPAICTPTITAGDFTDGTETTIENCEGNFFGTTRAGLNLGSNPTSTQNRNVEFTDVTGSGNFYVTWVDEGVPETSVTLTGAELVAINRPLSGFQITRPDASDTNPFTISIIVTVIP